MKSKIILGKITDSDIFGMPSEKIKFPNSDGLPGKNIHEVMLLQQRRLSPQTKQAADRVFKSYFNLTEL